MKRHCSLYKGLLRRRGIEHMRVWCGQLFLIEDTGAEVRVQCGEMFLSPPTLKEIDLVVNRERQRTHLKLAVKS